jgi:hypothetical protein
MKTFDTTIWPTWEALDGTRYADKHDPTHPVNVDFEIYRKRLQEYQLAAEYWQAYSGWIDGHGKKARLRRETIERFATLPHASESDYQ